MDNSQKDIQMGEMVCLVCKEVLSELADCRICEKCFTFQGIPLKRRFSETQIDVNDLLLEFEGEKYIEETAQFEIGNQQSFDLESPKRQRCESLRTTSSLNQHQNSCFCCSKKTGIFGFKCNYCMISFCKTHRLPQQHQCDVNFQALGRKKLKTQNPQVKPSKIIKF